jgi:nucleotide-binding universal stress UspA family protein
METNRMLKDIVVHLDPTGANLPRLEASAALAHRMQARLTGLYVVGPGPLPLFAADPGAGAALAAEAARFNEANPFVQRLEPVEQEFEHTARARGIDARWERADGPLAPALARRARAADLLVVGGGASEDAPDLVPPGLPGEAALSAGRPVLVIPRAGNWEGIGTRVLVAWDGSRESSRALHDALPLLAAASETTVVTFGSNGARNGLEHEAVDHLEAHGIAAAPLGLESSGNVGNDLAARATDLACNLLVMGAYGHSRLGELVFGGVTRYVLSHPSLPVLISH